MSEFRENEFDIDNEDENQNSNIVMDKMGFFIISPNPINKIITVDHYSPRGSLLTRIESISAKTIIKTIIENNWVSELSHAAYLGHEITLAELSIEYHFNYFQGDAW